MHDNFSNPAVIGPGVWYSIHLKSKHATTFEKKQEFVEYMKQLSEEFPCMNCRTHITEYLNNNPFDTFFQMVDNEENDIGLFKWGWIFHNAVNTRLGKPYVDWKTAWEMYSYNDRICSLDCGNDIKEDSSDLVNNNLADVNNNLADINNSNDLDSEYNSEENEGITIKGFKNSSNKQRSVNKSKLHNKDIIIQSYFIRKGIPQVLNKF